MINNFLIYLIIGVIVSYFFLNLIQDTKDEKFLELKNDIDYLCDTQGKSSLMVLSLVLGLVFPLLFILLPKLIYNKIRKE
jgi:formate hydrogenlyase subunit 3/multisubunit Na+/H+ antiporter MnhD subunit